MVRFHIGIFCVKNVILLFYSSSSDKQYSKGSTSLPRGQFWKPNQNRLWNRSWNGVCHVFSLSFSDRSLWCKKRLLCSGFDSFWKIYEPGEKTANDLSNGASWISRLAWPHFFKAQCCKTNTFQMFAQGFDYKELLFWLELLLEFNKRRPNLKEYFSSKIKVVKKERFR